MQKSDEKFYYTIPQMSTTFYKKLFIFFLFPYPITHAIIGVQSKRKGIVL